ncbi:MAG TPA: hypothetical protein VMR16_03870 [Candidatus Saccharimonadales bacterium]|nr:hypothetical protein [Candidatus Saccharimonadales bacterium]
MKKTIPFIIILATIFASLSITSISYAQPYGVGLYDENVPYGSSTSLSIATNGNVNIPITPTSSGVSATGTSQVTVTSTDVTGYKLYIRALNSTNMTSASATLPASANGTPAALAIDTWGYNTDASSNFTGISLSDALIHSTAGPVETGEITNVTYGIKLDLAKPAGSYTASVVYTAVPQTD